MTGYFSRRGFLKSTVVAGAASGGLAGLAARSAAAEHGARKFTLDLRCGSIGVRANQREAIDLAKQHGFESVTPRPEFLAELTPAEAQELQQSLDDAGLKWGAAGLSVEFRRDEATFREGLKAFPQIAAGMQQAGVTRVGTWLRPQHAELTYVANFRQHARRLRECVKVLADHGQRFGMEYVGPKTLWASDRHPFIHTMAETKDLISEIGLDNVGFVLDSWHWYTAHETVADLKTLSNRDIVACDLNDAPAGIAIDEQIDNRRLLPATSGVIDLKAFLSTLVELGYDGPVRAEPFNQQLNELDNQAAVAATATAMRKAFALVG